MQGSPTLDLLSTQVESQLHTVLEPASKDYLPLQIIDASDGEYAAAPAEAIQEFVKGQVEALPVSKQSLGCEQAAEVVAVVLTCCAGCQYYVSCVLFVH